MSTQIENIAGGRLTVFGDELPDVGLEIQRLNGARVDAAFRRDEFLAAVASELDVIIIIRDELPEVRKHGDVGLDYRVEFQDGNGGGIYSDEKTADDARRNALAWFGIAEYLTSHPPVDEADVEALSKVLYEATADPDNFQVPHVARRLLAAGVRPPEVTR